MNGCEELKGSLIPIAFFCRSVFLETGVEAFESEPVIAGQFYDVCSDYTSIISQKCVCFPKPG